MVDQGKEALTSNQLYNCEEISTKIYNTDINQLIETSSDILNMLHIWWVALIYPIKLKRFEVIMIKFDIELGFVD